MAKAAKPQNQGRSYDAQDEAIDATEQAYRDALGDGLEIVLAKDVDNLGALADGLNALNVHGPKGQRWTEEFLGTELERISR